MSGGAFNNIDYISFKNKTAASATIQTLTAISDADAAPFAISAITAVTPAVFTSAAHSFITGQTITTSATDSTPVLDDTYIVTVLSATTFTVSLNGVPQGATVVGTTGSVIATYGLVTLAGHGLEDGRSVTIASSDSTPVIDGAQVVNVLTEDIFEVPIATTVAGTTGTVQSELGTTAAPQHICYYCAPCPSIVSITLASPGVITTDAPHNLVTGDRVYLSGTDSTPALNGGRVVTVLSSTTFEVGVDTSGAGTANTGQLCIEKYGVKEMFIDSYDGNGDPTYLGEVLVNQRINLAEGFFEFIQVEDSAATVTFVKHQMLGYSDDVSKTTYSFLNPIETAFDWSAAASTLDAISTSTEDDSGDIGANTITVSGLIAGFITTADEAITMDGTTSVTPTSTTFLRVNDIKVTTVGTNADSGLSNSGIITVTRTTTGEHMGTIPIGLGRAPLGMYSVPSTESWCLSSINVQGEQKREFNVRIMVRENATASGPYLLYQTLLMGTQSLISGTNTEFDIPAQSDIWVTATQKSGQSGGEITVTLIGKLVTN
jgi:hypothetical protein